MEIAKSIDGDFSVSIRIKPREREVMIQGVYGHEEEKEIVLGVS